MLGRQQDVGRGYGGGSFWPKASRQTSYICPSGEIGSTQQIQNLSEATPCEFKSHLGHQDMGL